MSSLSVFARLSDRPDDALSTARRWRRVGVVGAVVTAVAATGVGDLPSSDELGNWPTLIWPYPRAWPAIALAYLGLTLLAGAWWQLRRATATMPDRLPFVLRTAVMWAVPLLLAPPLYSRDVYSYLAQGALYTSGMDPYRVGVGALGGPLADNVSTIWMDTPAPYGPLFLAIASAVTAITGHHIVLAVLMMRVVMVGSLAATTACMIPLARRFGVDPATAVWLGVLNPLTLAHVVSGAHNDVIMVMLMVVGLLLATRERPVQAAVLLGLAVLVKLPAAAAIAVVVPAMARQLPARYRMRYRMLGGAAIVSAVAVGTMLAVTLLMGTWYGWVSALSDTARIRNGLSISTNVGMLVNVLTWLVGAGTGSVDAVGVARALGVATAALLAVLVLVRLRGRPVYALALIMFAVVLLGPVVHPWYLLWGIVPLAVSTRNPRLVGRVGLGIIAVALYPMPWGEGFSPDMVWGLAGIGVGAIALGMVRAAPADDPPAEPEAASTLQLQAR